MFNKAIYSVLFVLFFAIQSVQGQANYGNFLNETNIGRKAEIGLELWNYYLRANLDSLKITSVELLLSASQEESEFARAVGTRMLGSYMFKVGKLDQGLQYIMSSKEYFEKKEDHVITSELYNEVGHIMYLKGEYDEAIAAYKKSTQIGKRSIDPTAEYNGKLGMGKSHVAKGDTSVGITFIQEYKNRAVQDNKFEAAADAFSILGQIESEKGNVNLSNEYFLRSLAYSKRSESRIHLSHSYANTGILKFGMDQLDSSQYYFEKSLELRLELGNFKSIVEGYYNLGYFHTYTGDKEKGIDYFNKSRDLAAEKGFVSDEIDAINELILIYTEKKNIQLIEEMKRSKRMLEQELKEKEGLDEEIIGSIDLDFNSKKKEKAPQKQNSFVSGWKELTIAVLAIGLIVFFLSERRKFN
jgi:tetratricopeptide (TPR) repeat protein